jgi:hypothetical protein
MLATGTVFSIRPVKAGVVNDGMLAINRELGFIPGDVIVTFEKVLR